MKKCFYLIVCAVALMFTSCGKQELKPLNLKPIVIETEQVKYEVDPRAEILMIACRLAKVNAFSDQLDNDYINTIDKMCKPLEKHPLVKQLKKASRKFQGEAFYELAIVDYISADMTSLSVDKKTMPAYLNDFWKKVNLNDFIKNYNDFANKSNFQKIWALYEMQLKGKASNVKIFYEKKPEVLNFIKDYMNDDVKFVFRASPILQHWIISMPANTENGQKTLTVYHSPGVDPAFDDDVYCTRCILDGLCYEQVINNWDKISEKSKSVINEIFTQNKIPSKKVKTPVYMENVVEIISMAINSKYIYANKEPERAEEIDKLMRKYVLLQDLSKVDALVDYYEENRAVYPDFDTFCSDYLVDVFNKEF